MMEQKGIDARVGKLEGEVEQVVTAVALLVKSVDGFRREFGEDMKMLSERVADKTAPNFATMAAWGAILLTIIGMVATPCGYFIIREMARQDAISVALDSKLQREQTLVADKISADLSLFRGEFRDIRDNGSPITRERIGKLEERIVDNTQNIDRLRLFISDGVKSDLDELRKRRMEK